MKSLLPLLALAACTGDATTDPAALSYPVVDSGQSRCFDDDSEIDCPSDGDAFSGQDAQHQGFAPDYTLSDGVVTDHVTGLYWQAGLSDRHPWEDAEGLCTDLELGGRDDWRLPSVEELYSLILFSGASGTADPGDSGAPDDAVPYLDDQVFGFAYGEGDYRYIDAQWATTSVYVSSVFADDDGQSEGIAAFFGVNFADGRIKGYPLEELDSWRVRCVAGNPDYGASDLEDGGDGTVTDHATGLAWLQGDSGTFGAGDQGDGTLDWEGALAWCEGLDHAGHDDWRLPGAKELHTLVDYSRSPDTTDSAAIDPVFEATPITAEDGNQDWGWYWSSTTHLDGQVPESRAVYVAFGEAYGLFDFQGSGESWMDVHGAGAQRSDPKSGSRDDYPVGGMGPQGDVQRVYNLARCVRDA